MFRLGDYDIDEIIDSKVEQISSNDPFKYKISDYVVFMPIFMYLILILSILVHEFFR